MSDESANQGIPEPEGPVALIETEYAVGQDNIRGRFGPFGLDIHNPVFLVSGLVIILFTIYTLALQHVAGDQFKDLRNWMTSSLDRFFIGSANIFVIFCLILIITPLGSVRLGGRDARPDYSYTGWFAMPFAAGMGIGLMVFGVSEPISHYNSSVGGAGYGVTHTGEAAEKASAAATAIADASKISGATVDEVKAAVAALP